MNVAIVCPDYFSTVLFCGELARTLAADVNNTVFVVSDRNEGRLGEQCEATMRSWGVELRRTRFFRFLNPWSDGRYIIALYRVFRADQIDVVIGISTKPNVYGAVAARLAGVRRVICSVWGLGAPFVPETGLKMRLTRYVVLCLYWLAFRLSSKVWFTNLNDRDYFLSRRLLGPAKTILSKNYVDTARYSPEVISADSRAALRQELKLQPGESVIVMVARMIWSKGVREFVEASRIVSHRFPKVRFLLVGPAEEHSTEAVPLLYLRESERLPNFRWLGFRTDVRELYSISDVAALPTYYKEGGFPRGLTEPMAMGLPVIAADSPDCRGTVEDGKNGYLVPPRDARALAEALERVLGDDDRRERFGRYSRQKAEREFSEQVIVPQVVEEMLS